MLTIDKQYAERDTLYKFSRSIGLPTRLADIHVKAEDLAKVTAKALAGIDVRVYPYTVTVSWKWRPMMKKCAKNAWM